MRIEVDFEGNITEHEDAPIVEPSAEDLQTQINQGALAYLASTDWYVVRFSETGVAIPDDVKAKRQEARYAIKEVSNG